MFNKVKVREQIIQSMFKIQEIKKKKSEKEAKIILMRLKCQFWRVGWHMVNLSQKGYESSLMKQNQTEDSPTSVLELTVCRCDLFYYF